MSNSKTRVIPVSLSGIQDTGLPIILNIDCLSFVERNMVKAEKKCRKSVIDFYFLYRNHPDIFGVSVFLVMERYIRLLHPSDGAEAILRGNRPKYINIEFSSYYWEPTEKYYNEREKVYLASMAVLPDTCAKIEFYKP